MPCDALKPVLRRMGRNGGTSHTGHSYPDQLPPNGDFYLPFLIIFIIKYYIKVKRFIGKVYINPCELSKSNKPTINKTRRAVVESAPDCAPHLGQAGALSDTSVPHSLHATKAIIHLAFSAVIWSYQVICFHHSLGR